MRHGEPHAKSEAGRSRMNSTPGWKPPPPDVPPGSLFGKALHYLHARWPKLIRYIEDGRISIDTNLVEIAIRPFAPGRRNWLVGASPKGATASAKLFSLIETAKASRIEPYRYPDDVFTTLPRAGNLDDCGQLLPWKRLETAGTGSMSRKTAA